MNSDEQVTLKDVEADRQMLAQAHKALSARRFSEWLLGSTLFTVVFGTATWFIQPSTSFGIYAIIGIVSFSTGGFAVLMNMKEQSEWRRATEAELKTIENKLRAGETVPRPNTSLQGTRRDKAASRP